MNVLEQILESTREEVGRRRRHTPLSTLVQEADARGVFLGDEVMDFMLTRFSRDLGSLMELLDLIDAFALQHKRAITVPLIRAMMDAA